jgi:bifunctional non-homologous end joining protein LigD
VEGTDTRPISHRDLMHATTATRIPGGGEWIFELKHDGFRCLARNDGGSVRLFSRRGRDMASGFPEIVREMSQLPGTVALDGELVVLDEKGRPDFERLSRRAITTLPISVQRAASRDPAAFFVFDLLWSRGKDLRTRPLTDRKGALQKLLRELGRVKYVQHVDSWPALYTFALDMQLEGIMAKRPESLYRPGRSRDWLKIKTPIGQKREQERFGK